MKSYEGRPFALIGVNSDKSRARALKAVAQNEINWRSFWSGEEGTRGEIPTSWNVRGWPTVVLLDHEGRIVWRGHFVRDEQKQKLEELVRAAETAKPKR